MKKLPIAHRALLKGLALTRKMWPDRLFLSIKYRLIMGYWPNLTSPNTFNEKLQWLKLHDLNPRYTGLVDKVTAKDLVAGQIGRKDIVIPTYGVWQRFDDIDFDSLPDRFVLKTNHDSGCVYVCRDKSKIDKRKLRGKFEKSLACNYFYVAREWPYKSISRCIMAEKFIQEASGGLTDYKFFCFNGFVDCVMICLDRHLGDTKFYFFDKEWNFLRLNERGLAEPEGFTLPKPEGIDEMFAIASELSKGFPFVRVDLYNVDGKIYFGEMTYYPDGGFDANLLKATDERWGKLIDCHMVSSK